MPKIEVKEKDLSWYYRQRDPSALTVYMPILATSGPEEPTLCDNSNFKSTYGTSAVGVAGDISYAMAASFVEVGLNVLVQRVIPEGAVAAKLETGGLTIEAKYKGTAGNKIEVKVLSAGNNVYRVYVKNAQGITDILTIDTEDTMSAYYYETVNDTNKVIKFTVTEAAITEVTTYKKLTGGLDYSGEADAVLTSVRTAIKTEGFFDDVKDPYQYSFDIVVDGGFNEGITAESTKLSDIDTAFKGLLEFVKDAIYLSSGVAGLTAESFLAYVQYFNTSYAAAYGPWGYQQLISTGTVALLPGYYTLLIAWANSIVAGNPVWMAPAGVKRAQLGTFYRKPEYEVGKSILDQWQNQDNIDSDIPYKVNPIMKLKQYGYCLYGNSTLRHSGEDGTTSMLQTFSVRVLANQIKKQAFDISMSLQFDQLDNDLFVQFKTLMGVYMDQLRYGGALYDYNIIADYSSMTDAHLNTKTVPVKIQISPNPTAENFEISLEISQAGVSFTDDTDETEVA